MTLKKTQKKKSVTGLSGGALGEVVDLFCGVGALSHGLKRAGFKIVAGYDTDARCKHAFEKNNNANFHARDVAGLRAKEIRAHFSGEVPSVLAGCAPCQPFSTYKQRYDDDPQWELVTTFAKLAVKVKPDFVTMENVPSLIRYKRGRVFRDFCEILEQAGYEVHSAVAKCELFGVPQKRRRLVVIASKNARLSPLKANRKELRTVRDAIGKLPKLEAGQSDPSDPLHTAATLGPLNLKRIKSSKPGGTWRDWPVELRAACHRRKSGKTYPGVYARMQWDQPSPTMTTQCFGFGNGRFGHPVQNRAITLREAAILQSFPQSYEFLPRGEAVSFKELGRWIGNAVPVKLINKYEDEFVKVLPQLKSKPIALNTALGVRGFIATVEKPRNLKITGTDERATLDLFVNGRLREKNILRHIFPRLGKVIFVHGCFWHRHNCPKATTPKTRQQFWNDKFTRNLLRDKKSLRSLRALGWEPLVVWECETKDGPLLSKRLRRFLSST